MNESHTTELAENNPKQGCINCGDFWVVPGYPNPLCQNCRDTFTKLQIPNWVKIFAAGIGLVILFSIYKIPRNIKTGIEFEKARTAMSEKKYFTAQKELQKVVAKAPEFLEAQSYLLISAYYNLDFDTFSKVFTKLKGENIKDQELFNQLDETLNKAAIYYGGDEIHTLEHQYKDSFQNIPDDTLRQFIATHDDVYAAMGYVTRLFDKKKYAACDSITELVLAKNPEFISGYMTLASSKRQLDKFDESIKYCDKVLSINSEYVEASSSKARTLLKAKKDTEALDLALDCYKKDEKNSYSICTLILAHHFNKNKKEEKELIAKILPLTDSLTVQSLRYVNDVISGKEFFRN